MLVPPGGPPGRVHPVHPAGCIKGGALGGSTMQRRKKKQNRRGPWGWAREGLSLKIARSRDRKSRRNRDLEKRSEKRATRKFRPLFPIQFACAIGFPPKFRSKSRSRRRKTRSFLRFSLVYNSCPEILVAIRGYRGKNCSSLTFC